MIPSRKEVKPVILDLMSDGRERSSEDLQEMVAIHFGLSVEERQRKRGKGPHPEYVNETAWALVDLQSDGLIKKTDPNRFTCARLRRLISSPARGVPRQTMQRSFGQLICTRRRYRVARDASSSERG